MNLAYLGGQCLLPTCVSAITVSASQVFEGFINFKKRPFIMARSSRKAISRSIIRAMIGEALDIPGVLMSVVINDEFPGVNPLAYVWGQCRVYGPFAKDGMDAKTGGLSFASVLKASPKTLDDLEKQCIEPWFKGKGWTVSVK